MDWITEAAAVLLAGLAFTLAAIGGTAAARYADRRLALVAGGLTAIGIVGVLGLLNQVSPAYGGPFAVALTPLLLLLFAVALIYVAVAAGGSRRPPR